MKGQIPNEKDQCFCEKEGRWMKLDQFYTYRDGSRPKMCKHCQTLHINNFEPDTFLWLLQEDQFDVPWVPAWWNKIRDDAFAKNPKKMNGLSVFGKYLSKCKMKQYSEYKWADSEKAQLVECGQAAKRNGALTEQEKKEAAAFEEQLRKDLASGKISEAQYQTLMPTPILNAELVPTNSADLDAAAANPYQEDNFIKQEDLPDPAADLTDEDKIYLAMKWGRLYRPDEWIQLEKDYVNMTESFDIKDADTKNALILICKTNLKLNQAIDIGDADGALKQSRMYDSLRKSAKLTAAQNKEEEKPDFIGSVGELVSYCEKEGGAIPKYDISAPQDIIDKVIDDLKEYNKSLIYSDTALARQIEDYLKRRDLLDAKKAELTDQDFSAYEEKMKEGKQEE